MAKTKGEKLDVMGAIKRTGTLLTVGMVVCVLGGLALARPLLASRLSRKHAEAAEAGHVSTKPNLAITWPDWMGGPIREQLSELLRDELSSDPLDDIGLHNAADRLLQTGWVAKVNTIRRETGNVVRLAATFRVPVALVRSGDKDHLVATGGELLPIAYPAGSITTFRIIVGAKSAAPEVFGEPWAGGEVQAAIALMGYLQPTDAYSQVWGIDTTDFAKSKRLTIVTDQQTRVLWGASPADWKPGEPPAATKLKWLLGLRGNQQFGKRIDAGRSMIDLTNPRGPLAEAAQTKSSETPEPPVAKNGAKATEPQGSKGSKQARTGH